MLNDWKEAEARRRQVIALEEDVGGCNTSADDAEAENLEVEVAQSTATSEDENVRAHIAK